MLSDTSPQEVEQVTTTVKGAAQILGQMLGIPVTNWGIYKLLDAGEIECRYKGARRLVVIESIHQYVRDLPTERPKSDGAA